MGAERAIQRSQDAASGGTHAEARQLINLCLSVNPLDRPCSAIEIWRHKFLASQASRKGFGERDTCLTTQSHLQGKSQPNNGQHMRFLTSFRSPTADTTQCEPRSNH